MSPPRPRDLERPVPARGLEPSRMSERGESKSKRDVSNLVECQVDGRKRRRRDKKNGETRGQMQTRSFVSPLLQHVSPQVQQTVDSHSSNFLLSINRPPSTSASAPSRLELVPSPTSRNSHSGCHLDSAGRLSSRSLAPQAILSLSISSVVSLSGQTMYCEVEQNERRVSISFGSPFSSLPHTKHSEEGAKGRGERRTKSPFSSFSSMYATVSFAVHAPGGFSAAAAAGPPAPVWTQPGTKTAGNEEGRRRDFRGSWGESSKTRGKEGEKERGTNGEQSSWSASLGARGRAAR